MRESMCYRLLECWIGYSKNLKLDKNQQKASLLQWKCKSEYKNMSVILKFFVLFELNFELGVLMRWVAKNVHKFKPTKYSKNSYLH